MDDLVQWLRAALDGEAEETRTVAAATEAHWSPGDEHLSDSVNEAESGAPVVVGTYEYLDWPVRQFIAAHDPARVLREIDAKRRIVDAHERGPMPKGGTADCAQCWGAVWPCPTLRLLALPFADRPGFQESWRP